VRLAVAGRNRLRFDARANVVWDGNSLVYGVSVTATENLPAKVAAQPPMVAGATTQNFGVPGYTWMDMIAQGARIDAAWDATKRNILVPWEITNTAAAGYSGSNNGLVAARYIAARRAAHPDWLIVLPTSLPRYDATGALCDRLQSADDYIRANWRALGADAICDVRAMVPELNFSGKSADSFIGTQSMWFETSNWIHLSPTGYARLALAVSQVFASLPKRRR
jgi:hypothetical protein